MTQKATSKPGRVALDLRVRFVSALIVGDREAASAAIDRGLEADLDVPTLLLDVLGAAQWEIGELWHRGDITIAQEHWGTQVTLQEIERVAKSRPAVRDLDRSVTVAAIPGETHTVPARLLAALFSWRGWRVDYLGDAPPAEALVEFVRQRRSDLVALSITLVEGRPAVVSLCSALGDLEPAPPVLLGGMGVRGLEADPLGATAVTADAMEGLDLAARLVGLGPERDLESYLALIGHRIQGLRRSYRISQAELSGRCGLTRPYLSAVERGRQNITLEAALRLAGALEVGMAELLSEDPR